MTYERAYLLADQEREERLIARAEKAEARVRGLEVAITDLALYAYKDMSTTLVSSSAFQALMAFLPDGTTPSVSVDRDVKPDNTALTFAAEAAGALETKHALPLLLPLLAHASPVVREGAIYGLSKHGAEASVREAFKRIASADESPGVRTAAADALAGALEDDERDPVNGQLVSARAGGVATSNARAEYEDGPTKCERCSKPHLGTSVYHADLQCPDAPRPSDAPCVAKVSPVVGAAACGKPSGYRILIGVEWGTYCKHHAGLFAETASNIGATLQIEELAQRTNDAKPIGTPKHTCRQPSDAEIEAGNVSYDLHCAGCIALLIHIRGSLLPVALFDARVDNPHGKYICATCSLEFPGQSEVRWGPNRRFCSFTCARRGVVGADIVEPRTDYPKGVGAGYLRERAPLYIPIFRDAMLKLADEIDAAEKAGWKPGDPCSAKASSNG